MSPYADITRLSTNADNMPTEINSIRDVAAAVRGRRQKLGLSQESVAQRARVSRQWLSEFESGKPTAELQLVMRLLDALGLRLFLDVPNETQRSRRASPPETVDLDMLLDEYHQS
jgi:HTH-type transcriptional regulator / antitoxin HipB